MVSGLTPDGAASVEDFSIIRNGEDLRVEVAPRDSALDLKISLPLGYALEVTTTTGDISIEGMVHLVHLETKTGAIRLTVPLQGIRMMLESAVPPPGFVNPNRKLFRTSELPLAEGRPWRLRDRLSDEAIRYGDYQITAEAPSSVELSEFEPPEGWPLRFPWEAVDELQKTLEPDRPASGVAGSDDGITANKAEGDLVFNSRVRMVNLSVAVSDRKGRPVPGLTAKDFRVIESNRQQRVGPVQDGDAAFNLAILLDMSGSSVQHREPIQAAARRFVEMARPGDRVAIYALTYGMFQVVSPLSADREALLAAVDDLPGIAGATPLYDIVALAYAQELRQLPGERNALIIVSDGLDNQLTGGSGPSKVKFENLERVAQEMNALIYPVFLLSGGRHRVTPRSFVEARNWRILAEATKHGSKRMQALASATGGRFFPAKSIEDLDPIFPLIEAELRSVYTLGYYPENQDLDGSWRTVEISVEKPGLTVRARPGYYAK